MSRKRGAATGTAAVSNPKRARQVFASGPHGQRPVSRLQAHRIEEGTGRVFEWGLDLFPGGIVSVTYGLRGGRMQVRSKRYIEGKAGRTPQAQAELESQQKFRTKLRTGYVPGPFRDSGGKPPAGRKVPPLLPMLLHTFPKTKSWALSHANLLLQPKLDGVRALFEVSTSTLTSRRQRPFGNPLEATMARLRTLVPKWESSGLLKGRRLVLDGELWAPGVKFHTINGAVQRKTGDPFRDLQVRFAVFDVFDRGNPDMPCESRMALLRQLIPGCRAGAVARVPTTRVSGSPRSDLKSLEARVVAFHKLQVAGGGEGTVIRVPSGVYTPRKRSRDTLKLKDFHQEEYHIHSVVPEAGHEDRAGAIVLRLPHVNAGARKAPTSRKTFSAGLKMDARERRELMKEAGRPGGFKGRVASVRFFETLESGAPRDATLVGFRDA